MTEEAVNPYNLKTPSDLENEYKKLKRDIAPLQTKEEAQQEAVRSLVQSIRTMNLLYYYLKG